jgi:hypothetical protein
MKQSSFSGPTESSDEDIVDQLRQLSINLLVSNFVVLRGEFNNSAPF